MTAYFDDERRSNQETLENYATDISFDGSAEHLQHADGNPSPPMIINENYKMGVAIDGNSFRYLKWFHPY